MSKFILGFFTFLITISSYASSSGCGEKGICTLFDDGMYVRVLLNNESMQFFSYRLDLNQPGDPVLKQQAIAAADSAGQKLENAGICVYLGEKFK